MQKKCDEMYETEQQENFRNVQCAGMVIDIAIEVRGLDTIPNRMGFKQCLTIYVGTKTENSKIRLIGQWLQSRIALPHGSAL